jgi:hypothetical protein
VIKLQVPAIGRTYNNTFCSWHGAAPKHPLPRPPKKQNQSCRVLLDAMRAALCHVLHQAAEVSLRHGLADESKEKMSGGRGWGGGPPSGQLRTRRRVGSTPPPPTTQRSSPCPPGALALPQVLRRPRAIDAPQSAHRERRHVLAQGQLQALRTVGRTDGLAAAAAAAVGIGIGIGRRRKKEGEGRRRLEDKMARSDVGRREGGPVSGGRKSAMLQTLSKARLLPQKALKTPARRAPRPHLVLC